MENLKTLLGIFISLILAITFFSVVVDTLYLVRAEGSVTNETIAFTDANPTAQLSQDDIHSVWFFRNGTQDFTANVSTTINWTEAGVVTIDNTTVRAGNYNISYLFMDDLYVRNATARTLMTMIMIFFAVGIIGIGFIFVTKTGLMEIFK